MRSFSFCCARVEVLITLHTPPSFTGCFPAKCHLSQPCCTKKGAFLPLTRPPTLPFFACVPSFTPEYRQSLPAAARIRSEPRESLARKPGIQAYKSAPEALGARLLCAAVCCRHLRWIVCLSSNIVPPCAAVVQLSLPVMAVRHDGTYLHTDHARLPWSAFLFRRGEVCTPRGDQIPVVGF